MRLEVNKRSYEHSNDLTPPPCSRNIPSFLKRLRTREPLEVSNTDSNETLFTYKLRKQMNLKKYLRPKNSFKGYNHPLYSLRPELEIEDWNLTNKDKEILAFFVLIGQISIFQFSISIFNALSDSGRKLLFLHFRISCE